MEDKVWFISGSARGFGRHWTQAALQRGDRIAATARACQPPLQSLVIRQSHAIM
jgi:NAD(P)-dependent dehydrogenase (short-subunit alcohol dehydrogenase family)